MSIQVVGAEMGSDKCELIVEVLDEDGELIGTAYGERNARLFAEAEEMFYLLKKFVEENLNCKDYLNAQKIINRIEKSQALTCNGLTEEEFFEKILSKNAEEK